jgi:hypothetical protein
MEVASAAAFYCSANGQFSVKKLAGKKERIYEQMEAMGI